MPKMIDNIEEVWVHKLKPIATPIKKQSNNNKDLQNYKTYPNTNASPVPPEQTNNEDIKNLDEIS